MLIDYKNQGRTFQLHGFDLRSKFGFSDGDLLHEVLFDNELTEHEDVGQHEVLVEVVKRYLLPALPEKIEVEEYCTCHNPIRQKGWPDVVCNYEGAFEKTRVTVTEAQVCEVARALIAEADK